jgi:hypothetical protein
MTTSEQGGVIAFMLSAEIAAMPAVPPSSIIADNVLSTPSPTINGLSGSLGASGMWPAFITP